MCIYYNAVDEHVRWTNDIIYDEDDNIALQYYYLAACCISTRPDFREESFVYTLQYNIIIICIMCVCVYVWKNSGRVVTRYRGLRAGWLADRWWGERNYPSTALDCGLMTN